MSDLLPDVENLEGLKSRIREMEKREEELERKLQVHQSLHSMILDSLQINVFLEDPEGRTIFANKQACQLNGMKLKDLAGKTVYDFFPKPFADMNRKVDLEVYVYTFPKCRFCDVPIKGKRQGRLHVLYSRPET